MSVASQSNGDFVTLTLLVALALLAVLLRPRVAVGQPLGFVSLALLLVAIAPLVALAQEANRIPGRLLAERSFPSTVLLIMRDAAGQPRTLGSGFVVAAGVVATNYHVISDARSGSAKVVGSARIHPIDGVLAVDRRHDLALLQVGALRSAPVLPLAEAHPAIGDEVFAVGNPEGFEGTFSQGIVSGIRGFGQDTVLQITAPISPGSSGGPVLSASGQVVGIAVATYREGQNLNFAVRAADLAALLRAPARLSAFGSLVPGDSAPSITAEVGAPATDAIQVFAITLGYRTVEYSVRNMLSSEVEKLRVIVLFQDSAGQQLDYWNEFCPGVGEAIAPGLARRCYVYQVPSFVMSARQVAIRVLDFALPRR